MKRRTYYRCPILLILVLIMLLILNENVYAEQESKWERIINDSDIQKIDGRDHIDEIVEVKKTELTYMADIESFDVSENCLVIMFSDDTMGIFDHSMKLRRSYELIAPGVISGVALKGENIVIFGTRSEYATEITQGGDYVALYDASNDNDRILDYSFTSIRKIGSIQYYVSHDKSKPNSNMRYIHSPYLIREDAEGNKEVLYDSHKYHAMRIIGIVTGLILGFAAMSTFIIMALCRKYRQNGGALKCFKSGHFESLKDYDDSKWQDGPSDLTSK